MPARSRTVRVEFTKDHDAFLAKYLAKYCPTKEGRSGRRVYDRLAANAQNKWPWSVHHTSQSWRERYVKHSAQFDAMILRRQRKHDSTLVDKRKRTSDPMPIEMLAKSAKRIKLEEEESSSSSDSDESTQHESKTASKSVSTSKPNHPPEPPETPPLAPHPSQEPRPINARPTGPAPSPPHSSADSSTSTNRKPTSDHSPLQTRHDTPEALSAPDQQLPLTDGIPEARSTPRHVKHFKVRLDTPSDMFASEPSSPKTDAAVVVGVQGPSLQTQPTLSAPNKGADGAPVAPSVHPHAPPRIVDSFHGQVLVDREGHIPRILPRGEKDGAEEEDDKARWPPVRGRSVKQRGMSPPDVEVDAHHPFSQPQPQPRPDQARPHPFAHVPKMFDGPPLHQRTAAARFSGQVRHAVAPQVESKPHEDEIRNGASTVKPAKVAAPPTDLFSGHIPKHPPKVFKLPAPHAPTRSKETRQSPRQSSPTKRSRYPGLARIRRQTIGNGNGNGYERERRREVPSVDLVALSHSSMSARSHSRSSADTSVPTRPSRWSLPAFVHATPWILDEWALPPPVYGDLGGDGRAQTSSTPRLMYTPSPVRSNVGTSTSPPLANSILGPPSLSLVPHPPDLQLAVSNGLALLLAHMSANHRLALSVVEAVYKRVGNLREADEVLKGMREAAEGFGEREIERRVRERRGGVANGRRKSLLGLRGDNGEEERSGNGTSRLRYVVASEDGEWSEYTPPETSRAAMWMRQSESTSYVEEKDEDDEEAAEGREVEEELRDGDEDEDDGEGAHHNFSRYAPMAEGNGEVVGQDEDEDAEGFERVTNAILEDTRLAIELERKLGKQRFRRNVAMLFMKPSQT